MSPLWGRSRTSARRKKDFERLQDVLEGYLASLGDRASANASGMMRSNKETLADLANQIRHGAFVAGDQATRFGSEAAKHGETGLRWLSDEAKNRPLPTLAVAAGIGLLVGLLLRRNN